VAALHEAGRDCTYEPMLTPIRIGGERREPQDVVDHLLACHERIRRFGALALRLPAAGGTPAGELAEAASSVARYFTEAGFQVAAMEGIEVPFEDVGRLSPEEIYKHTKKAFLKHRDVQAIYMLGSGWRLLKIVGLLEQDLEVPVIYALAAKLWDVQKRFHVRQPVKGYGRLLEELP